MATFKIKVDTAGEYYWVLKAANGETVAVSESYKAKASARNSAERVKVLAYGADIEG